MRKSIDNLICPALAKKLIDFGYCQELQMATDNEIIWEGMEDRFTEEQMEICRKCIKREDPAAD